jgi:hypothetical protein
MYIVISKPKRRSVAAGVVQFIFISIRGWLYIFTERFFNNCWQQYPASYVTASGEGLIAPTDFHESRNSDVMDCQQGQMGLDKDSR